MKKMIFTAILALSSFASAQSADQLRAILECHSNFIITDAGTNVTVVSGGYAGITQLHVTKQNLAGAQTENYIVQDSSPRYLQNTSDIAKYIADGARLTVNFSAPLNANGEHPAVLQTKNANGSVTKESLLCRAPRAK